MALAAAVQGDGFNVWGTIPIARVTLTPGTGDYLAGGYILNGKQFNLGSTGGPAGNGIRGVIFTGGNTATLGFVPFYNQQTGAFQILVTGTASGDALNEVANAGNPAGGVWYAVILGESE